MLQAVLLLIFTAVWVGGAASAESAEGGFWSERLDGEGRTVRVFTYTEPIAITQGDGEPMENEYGGFAAAEPVEETLEAPVYLAGEPSVLVSETAGLTADMLVFGVLTLLGMALVLYKAV